MLSKKTKLSLPSRPEPPKWDSIHQDIECAGDDDVAFSFFLRQRNGIADESAASFESQLSPEEEDTEKNAASGLRHRFGEVIAASSPTSIGVSSAISNVVAAASDALNKQRTPSGDGGDKSTSATTTRDDGSSSEGVDVGDDGEEVIAAAPTKANIDEAYKNVLSFLEANRKLQALLGKREEKKLFDQSFESVGEGRDEDFLDPVDDDDDDDDVEGIDDRDSFKDDEDDSMAITSIGGLGGGDTIAECDDYLPRDKQDNFQDLVSKLDNLKQELSLELAELMDKTATS